MEGWRHRPRRLQPEDRHRRRLPRLRILGPYYHLSGERMDRIGEGTYEIRRGAFTTCQGDDPPWSFRLNSGTADHDDIVYGRDASLWVKSVSLPSRGRPGPRAAVRLPVAEFGQSSRRGYFAAGVPTGWVDLVLANPEVESCQKEEHSSAQDSRVIGRRRNERPQELDYVLLRPRPSFVRDSVNSAFLYFARSRLARRITFRTHL